MARAKEIYSEAFARRDELCSPYATVIDVDPAKLPPPHEVRGWSSEQYTSALRHVSGTAAYNSIFRQLLHVGFKIAARMGRRYLDLLELNEAVIAKNVTEKICTTATSVRSFWGEQARYETLQDAMHDPCFDG